MESLFFVLFLKSKPFSHTVLNWFGTSGKQTYGNIWHNKGQGFTLWFEGISRLSDSVFTPGSSFSVIASIVLEI